MYIKLKINYNKHKAGSIIKVSKGAGNYLVRSGNAEIVESKETKKKDGE